ncbi:putative copper-importing P-type ATPase A [Candidatus Magnetaquicoccaceae bacterium FCR-1]|uniref:Copper-importing P-type ATPase A n=1 Tax=Candidatus Magnetaquiglobus chichijimensis TaxID=3141448 RepID=A0ABQ0C5K6_9PROT
MTTPDGARFEVAHRLNRRLRVVIPGLRRDEERCALVAVLLMKHPAIRKVRVEARIGSLAIHFDPESMAEAWLSRLLGGMLAQVVAARMPSAGDIEPVDPDAPAAGGACTTLAVEGMSCASCAMLIEMRLRRHPGVTRAQVHFATGMLEVAGRLDRGEVARVVGTLGYAVRPLDTPTQRRLVIERERQLLAQARRRLLLATALTLPVAVLGMLMPRGWGWKTVEFLLATPVVFGAGASIFKRAWLLARQGSANMDSLIALGAGSAYVYSVPVWLRGGHHLYFEAAASIVTFVLLGRYLEEKAKGKAGDAIRQLMELQPETATRILPDGREELVPIDALRVGERIRIRPGERIAADGVVVAGDSSVNESLITGESLPVGKSPDDKVVAGCINGAGSLQVEVRAVGADTVLAGIIHLVEQAQNSRLPVQKLVDRVSARFVPGVLLLAGMTALYWLRRGRPVGVALTNAVSVLLIACPCALGLATPTAIMAGTGHAARRGIYIRGGESLEVASRLQVVILDKTGTLTAGHPRVIDFHARSPWSDERILTLAGSAELPSEHFLGRAVVSHARSLGHTLENCESFVVHPGQGVEARVAGHSVAIGNAAWLAESDIDTAPLQAWADRWAAQGMTPLLMAVDGAAAAVFAVADPVRADARLAVRRLRQMGLRVVMVTGDLHATARHVAERVGIREILAEARPHHKVAVVQRLKASGLRVAMVGDGINDAPALAAADVGFAMGSGADVAMETAGMTLVGGELLKLPEAILLSRRTLSVIRQNLFWALIYNLVAIPEAARGRLNPMIASAAMAMSSVSVVLSALRLQHVPPEEMENGTEEEELAASGSAAHG